MRYCRADTGDPMKPARPPIRIVTHLTQQLEWEYLTGGLPAMIRFALRVLAREQAVRVGRGRKEEI